MRGRQAHGAKPGDTSSACHVIRSLARLQPKRVVWGVTGTTWIYEE